MLFAREFESKIIQITTDPQVRTWYLAIRDIPDGKADTIVEKLKEFLKVTETGTSQSMETEGFRRGLDFLLNEGVDVVCVVTDRHRGVRKVLKEPNALCQDLGLDGEMPETTDPVESVQGGTGQEEGDEDAGLATPFTTALKHLKGAPEEMKLNQTSDMYMDFLSQVPEVEGCYESAYIKWYGVGSRDEETKLWKVSLNGETSWMNPFQILSDISSSAIASTSKVGVKDVAKTDECGTDHRRDSLEFMAGRQTDSPAEGFPKKVHSAINNKTCSTQAEEVPRLQQLQFRSREDSSIIAVRAFLSARNRPTLRQRFHYIAVGLPQCLKTCNSISNAYL
ncbi:hypothetical protein Bbelb_291370 [Branchiostoma belcheri]|nr:hypothetical protein Bbelb_291370 [Branchiostoma belcheri]